MFLRVISCPSCDEVLILDDREDAVGKPRKRQIESYERHIQELFLPITTLFIKATMKSQLPANLLEQAR